MHTEMSPSEAMARSDPSRMMAEDGGGGRRNGDMSVCMGDDVGGGGAILETLQSLGLILGKNRPILGMFRPFF